MGTQRAMDRDTMSPENADCHSRRVDDGNRQPRPQSLRQDDRPMLPFVDLAAQRRRLGERIDSAIARVLDHGRFIMGPEVRELERELADHCGSRHAIACSSGTDALLLALMALRTGPGHAVLVPSFTFVATAEAVALLGAVPVFVDVDPETFCLDKAAIRAGVATARDHDLQPVGVISVDLFGQPADYGPIEAAASEFGLWLVCDAAQSFGASLHGRKVGTFGRVTTTSFYPSKPLGCYGDGGALFTDDDSLAATIRSVVDHGAGSDKYDNVRIGMNGRLDTIQAAILLEKLTVFDDELTRRQSVAYRYSDGLGSLAGLLLPRLRDGAASTWAQYTLRLDGIDRETFRTRLGNCGVPTAVYYPRPLHRQTAYRDFPMAGNGLPASEALSASVASLPIHAYLDPGDQDAIMGVIHDSMR